MPGLRILLLIYLLRFAAAFSSLEQLKRKIYRGTEQLTDFINRLGAITCLGCSCDKYPCPKGKRLMPIQPNSSRLSNGCGAYGLSVPRVVLPLLTACCNEHDICYGTCGISRSVCDREFKTCLDGICVNVTTYRRSFASADPEACWRKARLFDALVRNFGCGAFLAEQQRLCYCG